MGEGRHDLVTAALGCLIVRRGLKGLSMRVTRAWLRSVNSQVKALPKLVCAEH